VHATQAPAAQGDLYREHGRRTTPAGGTLRECVVSSSAHDLIRRFTVDLLVDDGTTKTVMDQAGYDLESDLESYEPTLDLADVASIRYACEFENPYDTPVTYGTGKNEMCILFGYLHPPSKQFAAYVDEAGAACTSLQIG
jgi:hypothetical protein